jgi:hypothetical protein
MNQKISLTKSESFGPLSSPLHLQLDFPKLPQRDSTLSFHLSLQNVSKNSISIYRDLSIGVVIFAELRTVKGELIDLWQGPVFQIPTLVNGSKELPSLKSIKRDYEWPSFYKKIDKSMGDVRIQFNYDTRIVEPPLEKYSPPVERSMIYSNSIVLRAKDNMIHVLGNYHKILPHISRDYIKKGLKLTKEYDDRVEKSAIPILRAITPDGVVRRTILTPYDLENLVHLKNNQDALDFVRLFTARDTHFLFRESNFLEIQSESDTRDNGLGIDISEYWWRKYRLNSPVIKKIGDSYTVNRYLISYPNAITKKCKIYLSDERVHENGKYQHKIAKIIDESPFDNGFDDKPNIHLPYY